mmetsp:Transcript_9218/g.18132  ORF Transcript_9218/g.18132 Transcript_9218/m.18132 type:complete len:195 (+) Transcript_9218:206-790(+)
MSASQSAPATVWHQSAFQRGQQFVHDGMREATRNMTSLWSDIKRAYKEEQIHMHCHDRRSCTEALMWTNFIMVIPAYVYHINGFNFAASSIIFSACMSLLYHLYSEKVHWHLVADKIAAVVAFAGTAPPMLPRLSGPGVVMAFFLVCLAFWFKHHQEECYSVYHSLWHFSIFVGQIFLTFHLDITPADLLRTAF